MSKTLEFYFDVGSPAAYLAWTQLPQLCADTGAQLVSRPMLLGAVFQATGNQSPALVPAKGAYMMTELQRFSKRYGVPFAHNPHFPINTLLLMRGATGLQMQQPDDAYLRAVYEAIWVHQRNMGDPSTVAAVLQAAGFDAPALLALAGQQAVKDELKRSTTDAVARGVFGAPTCFVGDQMFWGQDRLDFVREALRA